MKFLYLGSLSLEIVRTFANPDSLRPDDRKTKECIG